MVYQIASLSVSVGFLGYPDPEVVWYKDDQPIRETRHFQIDYDEEGNCSLVISEVTSHNIILVKVGRLYLFISLLY